MPDARMLFDVLREPARGRGLAAADWAAMLHGARQASLLPKLSLLLEIEPWAAALPLKIREQLAASRPVARQHERVIRWEVNRIASALAGVNTKLVLLKGAAYVMAGLRAGHGRLVTDVDVLVPRADIERVEEALRAAGWAAVTLHPYDQRFYRQWSHELPPLRHEQRGTVVDVHHNILPATGRLRPDAAKLIEAAVPIGTAAGARGLWVLAPDDMVLHSAAHLFQDGDLSGSVRDVVDIDALLRQFGSGVPDFWDRLTGRAETLGLQRPLFYALRYASRLLRTDIPPRVTAAAAAWGPPGPMRAVMDALVDRALVPVAGRPATVAEDAARLLLYVRSHWLRMPPHLLAVHLTRKAGRRWTSRDE